MAGFDLFCKNFRQARLGRAKALEGLGSKKIKQDKVGILDCINITNRTDRIIKIEVGRQDYTVGQMGL
jgi:hypothetical protein